jgi:hypothetical protein
MLDPNLLIGVVKTAAPFTTRLAIDKFQRNETVIRILQRLS